MLNNIIAKTLPYVPKSIVHVVAKRYVAGANLEDAVRTVQQLNKERIFCTMDVLGEFVDQREPAEEATAMASRMIDQVAKHDLKSGISVKLTSLGLDVENEFCYSNLKGLVEKARAAKRFLRIDMENSPYTDRTLDMYRRLRADGFSNVGVVIQAYMRRSVSDIASLAPLKTSVRLCKGIYNEDASIAYKGREEIRDNYKQLLVSLFESGMHPAIATHDDVLIDFARDYIAKNKIDKERYEFQMLLGVRENKRDELVAEGHRMRIYVPFGQDWYGYSLRRLKENPEIGGHIFWAMLGRDR